MRCLFVADLHYTLPQFDWLLRSAPRYDLVILAGDALDIASAVDFRAQTLVVRKYLQRLARTTRFVVCSGNHDLDSTSEDGEKVPRWLEDIRALGIPTDGDSIVIDDMRLTICPWWDGPVVRARLMAQLAADAQRRDGLRWVWVHHAPPLDSPTSWSGSKSLGDADVARWIAEYGPDMVVSGHIHQAPFRKGGGWIDCVGKTWVFNTGRQLGVPPAAIAFDSTTREAIWFSQMDVQRVQLDAPLQQPIPSAESLPDWLTAPAPARVAPKS